MHKTYKIALTEVFEILEYLPKDIKSKIPKKLMEFIEKEKDDSYIVDIKQPLNIEDYSNEAIVLLGMIYTDFLCSQEEKNELIQKSIELNKKFQQESLEKYNPDNIFKAKKDKIDTIDDHNMQTNLALVKVNENWFTKIKKIFARIM